MTFKLGPNQEKWLAALESGEYEQGSGYLVCDGRYCCLGVADKVLHLGETLEQRLSHTFMDIGLNSGSGSFMRHDLPAECLVGSAGVCDQLTLANDRGATFAEIAAFIRANPEVVFKEAK